MFEEMKKNIVELSKKQTWIRKGLKELIRKVNKELESTVEHYFVDSKEIKSEEWSSIDWRYDSGKVGIFRYNYAVDGWDDEVNIDDMSIIDIRLAIEKFPQFIENVEVGMQNMNKKYDEVTKILNKYLTA